MWLSHWINSTKLTTKMDEIDQKVTKYGGMTKFTKIVTKCIKVTKLRGKILKSQGLVWILHDTTLNILLF